MIEPRYVSPRPRMEGGVWGSYVGYLNKLEHLLRDIAASGVSDFDPRLSYVDVQIDTDTWGRWTIRINYEDPS